jgi:hypothetical protein
MQFLHEYFHWTMPGDEVKLTGSEEHWLIGVSADASRDWENLRSVWCFPDDCWPWSMIREDEQSARLWRGDRFDARPPPHAQPLWSSINTLIQNRKPPNLDLEARHIRGLIDSHTMVYAELLPYLPNGDMPEKHSTTLAQRTRSDQIQPTNEQS